MYLKHFPVLIKCNAKRFDLIVRLFVAAAQSDRMIVNTWKSVYSTLDEDKDGMVTTTEITDTLSTYNPGAIVS